MHIFDPDVARGLILRSIYERGTFTTCTYLMLTIERDLLVHLIQLNDLQTLDNIVFYLLRILLYLVILFQHYLDARICSIGHGFPRFIDALEPLECARAVEMSIFSVIVIL